MSALKWWCAPTGCWNGRYLEVDRGSLPANYNQGDVLITDSMMRLVDWTQDCMILRGSNFMRSSAADAMDNLARQLEQQGNAKVVFWSLGVGGDETRVISEMRRFGAVVDGFGVRGEHSAGLLRQAGIHSDVVYCPTLLRGAFERVRHPTAIRKVLVAMQIEHYGGWPQAVLRKFKERGVEVHIHLSDAPGYEMVHLGQRPPEHAEMMDRETVVFARDAREWDWLVQDYDLVFSDKLHGSLPALAHGIPTYTVRSTKRISEIMEPLGLPLVRPEAVADKEYEATDFDGLPGAVETVRVRTRAFLSQHGILRG